MGALRDPFTGSSHRFLQPHAAVHSLSASLQKSNPPSWTRMTCSEGLFPEARQKLDLFRMSGMTYFECLGWKETCHRFLSITSHHITLHHITSHILLCEAGFLNPTLSGCQAMRGKATGLMSHSSKHWHWDCISGGTRGGHLNTDLWTSPELSASSGYFTKTSHNK